MQFRRWAVAVGSLALSACSAPPGAAPSDAAPRAAVAQPSRRECETACGPGLLQGSRCIPDVAPLRPVWSYLPPARKEVAFNGLLDAEGNSYWLEFDASGHERRREPAQLISVDRAGHVRFRRTLPTQERLAPPIGTRLGVVYADRSRVEARRKSDGEASWTASLSELVDAAGLGSVGWRPLLATNGDGAVVVMASSPSRSGRPRSLVVAFDEQTGQVRWRRVLEGRGTGLISDGSARVFLSLEGGGRTLFALGARGEVRWQTNAAAADVDAPVAVVGSALVLANGQTVGLNDGQPRWRLPAPLAPATTGGALVGSRAGAYFVGPRCNDQGCDDALSELYRVTPSGQLAWSRSAGAFTHAPVLASGDGLLAIEAKVGDPTSASTPGAQGYTSCLRRWTSSGDSALNVALPGPAPYVVPSALSRGRLVTAAQLNWGARGEALRLRISAFDVPGAPEAAQQGWVTHAGNLQRSGAPRG